MLSDVAVAGNELERVVHDLKLELTGKSKKHNKYQSYALKNLKEGIIKLLAFRKKSKLF